MARFVEFTTCGGKKIWLNPDCCVSLMDALGEMEEQSVAVIAADGETPYHVMGTVPEVMAKLQGEQPAPAPAADDIVGWWCENVTGAPIYVIGKDSCGFYTYEMEENLVLRSRPEVISEHYFRDPNRKGWEG